MIDPTGRGDVLLMRYTPTGGSVEVAGYVQQWGVSQGQAWVYDNGDLYLVPAGGTVTKAYWSGVKTLLVDASGGVDALLTSGALMRWSGGSGEEVLLSQGVQSIGLTNDGYTLDALLTNGHTESWTWPS
jgi:hypothetical protein